MVWQAAQLRVNRLPPDSRLALLRLTIGTGTPVPGVCDCTKAAISRVSVRLNRDGFSAGWTLDSASGIRPVDTQKSTVPAPNPWRFGPRAVPDASLPWQEAQLASYRAWPGAMNDSGSGTDTVP